MIIGIPEITSDKDTCYYKTDVSFTGERKDLWFSIEKDFINLISSSSDAALAALIIPAMDKGEDISIDGTISEKLFINFSGPFQKTLQNIMPWLKIVKIIPNKTSHEINQFKGVATGFSGGIDSYCTLSDHFFNLKNSPYKITHLLFNNVGSHGSEKKSKDIFNKRYNHLYSTVTKSIGIPFIKVNSNINCFYNKKINFKQTHTVRNSSVALLLQNGISRFLYSSGISYSDSFIGPKNDMAYSDIASLPLLGTEKLETISTGGEYSRVEKTLKVASIPESYKTLDVCARGHSPINCSCCKKCMRTLLTLEISQNLEKYSNVFDLNIYRREKKHYLSNSFVNKDPLFEEIIQYSKNKGIQIDDSIMLFLYYKIKSKLKRKK